MPSHHSREAGARIPATYASSRRGCGSRSLSPIDAAVQRLDDLFHCCAVPGLTPRGYKVLRHLVTAADLRHPGAVYPTPSKTLQQLTGYGDRSISGANTDLARAGLIERVVVMQGRQDPEWRTVLTPYCLGLLFEDHSQKSAPPVDKGLNSFESQGATPPAFVDNCPQAEQPEQPAPQPPATGKQIHVRDDLTPLLQVMQPEDVRQVLAIAKAKDVWVQDVMAHRLDRILRAREPVNYLISLIGSGEDWKQPVEVRHAAALLPPAAADDSAAQAAAGEFLACYAGCWLAKPDESVLLEVYPHGCIEHKRAGRGWLKGDVAATNLPRIADAAQAGRLVFIDAAAAAALLTGMRYESEEARDQRMALRMRARGLRAATGH